MLLALVGCDWTPSNPELPTRLVIADGVSEGDAEAFEAAAADWNAELPTPAIRQVVRGGRFEGCGIFVMPGDRLPSDHAGRASMVAPCMVVVKIAVGLDGWRRRVAAQHELGHALEDAWDSHSDDPRSVMYPGLRGPEQAILPDDVAPVLERMTGGGD